MEPLEDTGTAAPADSADAAATGGWRGWARVAADLVFPPSCVHCGDLVEASPLRMVCVACVPLLVRVEPPCCPCCGHPFFGEASGERLCVHCEGLRPEFGEGRTAVLFRGPARSLVHTLKYRQGLHVLGDMAKIVAANPHVADFLRGAVLVPVPLHGRKERERGYNQASEYVQALVSALGGATRCAAVLARVIDTQTQTSLDRAQRQANLKNAFALAPGVGINPELRYVLIDDVFTTGSTLNACAAVLRRAGALKVDVCTFGHG
ncbi:MAG: ComF family protein [Verrucomicrobia bacterium]|nr:ComF family protein [Verrucomicrobiota bacterium]